VLSSDFLGLNDLDSLSGLNDLNGLISQKDTEFYVSINHGTKMTYPGPSMWNGSSKTHYFIDFWHPFS
jgi:hypothetical protein